MAHNNFRNWRAVGWLKVSFTLFWWKIWTLPSIWIIGASRHCRKSRAICSSIASSACAPSANCSPIWPSSVASSSSLISHSSFMNSCNYRYILCWYFQMSCRLLCLTLWVFSWNRTGNWTEIVGGTAARIRPYWEKSKSLLRGIDRLGSNWSFRSSQSLYPGHYLSFSFEFQLNCLCFSSFFTLSGIVCAWHSCCLFAIGSPTGSCLCLFVCFQSWFSFQGNEINECHLVVEGIRDKFCAQFHPEKI